MNLRLHARWLCLGFLAVLRSAQAEPQFNAALLPGVAVSKNSPHVAFYGGAHLDVMLGREHNHDLGLGPALDVATIAFDDLRLSPALGVQLPTDPLNLVVSLGPLFRIRSGLAPGVAARLFLGLRAYNYYGSYAPAVGLSLGVDALFGSRNNLSGIAALHLDAEYLAVPWLILINWFRGHDE